MTAENCHYEAVKEYLENTTVCYINPFSRISEVPYTEVECICDFITTNKGYNVCGDQRKILSVEFIGRD